MPTHCHSETLHFSKQEQRNVVAKFDGGPMSSDAGALLLKEINRLCKLTHRLAACYTDYRDPSRIEHSIERMLAQRIIALCLGYDDLNDHDHLRGDSILALALGCSDITGQERSRQRDKGYPLASSKTLNRLELSRPETAETDRHKRTPPSFEKFDALIVDLFMEMYAEPPKHIILDLDATDDVLHGNQEGRFYHGYYGNYCYLPLCIFCGEHPLVSRLRRSNIDASAGTVEELARVVAQIRLKWPKVEIWIRADSGFCRDSIMAWCEANDVSYILGLGRNSRLQAKVEPEMEASQEECKASGQAARRFCGFRYRTIDSWSSERRVVAKAEYLPGPRGYNARFVVTNLDSDTYDDRLVYEDLYCARGDMENRIKEQQLDLFADRTSSTQFYANQVRLYFSTFAQIFMARVKEWGLKGTEMASAQCGTIRVRLLKVSAVVHKSVRRFKLALSSSYPWQQLFARVLANLCAIEPVVHNPVRPPPV